MNRKPYRIALLLLLFGLTASVSRAQGLVPPARHVLEKVGDSITLSVDDHSSFAVDARVLADGASVEITCEWQTTPNAFVFGLCREPKTGIAGPTRLLSKKDGIVVLDVVPPSAKKGGVARIRVLRVQGKASPLFFDLAVKEPKR